MSEQPTDSVIEKPRRKLLERLKKGGALAASSIALSGVVAPVANAEHSSSSAVAHEAAANILLRDPHELPGLKKHLGRETLDKIKASTVEIVYRYNDPANGFNSSKWSPSCTGVKVSMPGKEGSYVMTAAHCFRALTGMEYGAFTDTSNPLHMAENFSGGNLQYAIADPGDTDLNERLTTPTATVTGISISTAGKDSVLMETAATPIPEGVSTRVRPFGEIPALPLKVAQERPVQGTPVALYGEPQANNFEPIVATGIYLGRVWFSEYSNTVGVNESVSYRQLDLVGINPSEAGNDNCNYGTSGSMALLQDGTVLGNLSLRTSNGYGPDKVIQSPDSVGFDKYIRPIWEKELDVSLSDFSTICGYTVMDPNTPTDLLGGFNIPAPEPVGGKGGAVNGAKP